ncbi:MAG: pyridoxal-phosphate dependent enzyme [Caulobacterales bacterium]
MSLADTLPALALADIQAARARIAGKVNVTPVMTSHVLDEAAGVSLFFKCENFQKAGAFKARGAANAVFKLTSEAAARGVATHSSGNHAAALARAAGLRGIAAHIVMPSNVSKPKAESVARYGGQIVYCEPTLAAREAMVAKVVAETGAVLIHPYDNLDVMAGAGTAAVELMEQAPDLDAVIAPIGGGGLISGTAVAVKSLSAKTRVVGVEPASADDAARSVAAGRLIPAGDPVTIADGLRASLSPQTFALIRTYVDQIVAVSEAEIIEAMRAIWSVMKIIVEPSSAVPYAAIRAGRIDVRGQRVGIILTGGNLDLDKLPWA